MARRCYRPPASAGPRAVTGSVGASDATGVHDLRSPGLPFDRDGTGLHGLGYFAFEDHMQEAVLELGTVDLHEIGQLEAALEGARGNSLMQELVVVVDFSGRLLAGDRE